MGKESSNTSELLLSRPIKEFYDPQLDLFTKENLQIKSVLPFSPQVALEALHKINGQEVLAIDSGGTKTVATKFLSREGKLQIIGETTRHEGLKGEGNLAFIQDLMRDPRFEGLSVGLACCGPIEGTRPLANENAPVFLADLKREYDGDFSNLIPNAAVANDGVASVMSGSLLALEQFPNVKNVICFGNSTGMGTFLLVDGTIIASESGHIPIVSELNPYRQKKKCGVSPSKETCIESVASGGGMQDIWQQQTGELARGEDIHQKYLAGNKLALDLYDNSAYLTALMIHGVAKKLNLWENPEETALVGFGGTLKVTSYEDRLKECLQRNLGFYPQIIFANHITDNLSLDGAAIAALSYNIE